MSIFFNTTIHAILFLFFTIFSTKLMAQNQATGEVSISIPEVAMLDIESQSGSSIFLTLIAPSEAGESIDFSQAKDSSLWLNYSSVRSKTSESNRSIYARITSGNVPNGLRLRVRALDYDGSGDGQLGIPVYSGQILNSNDKRVIRQIKTCYTGNGLGNGHQLVYSLELRNNGYQKIKYGNESITILYTISDE